LPPPCAVRERDLVLAFHIRCECHAWQSVDVYCLELAPLASCARLVGARTTKAMDGYDRNWRGALNTGDAYSLYVCCLDCRWIRTLIARYAAYVEGDPFSTVDRLGLLGGRGTPTRLSSSTDPLSFGGGSASPGFCGSGWNQPFVPDRIGSGDIAVACRRHDDCYSRCGANKEECDLQLRRDIIKQCEKLSSGVVLCKTLAVDYAVSVQVFGGGAFSHAQSKCSSCY